MKWSNPIKYPHEVDGGRGLRDPFILKHGDFWYLTGTMYPYCESDCGSTDPTPGVPLYKTQDFKNWQFEGLILSRPDPALDKWYQKYFWAPEIFCYNGKFYLTVNCSKKGHYDNCGNDSLQGVLVAVAEDICGPYTVLTDQEPLFYGNDAHLFADDDGKTYIFATGIVGAEIDLESMELKTPLTQIIAPVPNSDAWNAQRDGVGLEGPFVCKVDGVYYMFYSTWSRGYEIGVAKSDSPLGKWQMDAEPFYGAMSKELCERFGGIYQPGYYAYDYREAGHNSVFIGDDGERYIAAHVFMHGDIDTDVALVLDRLYFENGEVFVLDKNKKRVNGPTYG